MMEIGHGDYHGTPAWVCKTVSAVLNRKSNDFTANGRPSTRIMARKKVSPEGLGTSMGGEISG
ncbi:MAG TPA: hypothetical protein P5055_18555, partial [Candidatus Paceibacterota bacterium]|nr:hypothetical protein [Candidatus Paceibacterota bacterium]